MPELCTDTLSHCLLFLDVQEIVLNCSLVNKQWLKCSRSNNIWNNIYNTLFMDDIFNWRSHTTNQNDAKKKKKKSSDAETQQNKKQKFDESTDSYWFDLVKQFMIFPTWDLDKDELNDLSLGKIEEICKIRDIDKLHDIIRHLRNVLNEDRNADRFYYNCERFTNTKRNATLEENYLRLSLLLTVMFDGKQNYFRDNIVISLGVYNANDSDDDNDEKPSEGNEEKFICTLPTFCMLVLYPDSQDLLPFKQDEDEDMYFRSAPYLEDSNNSGKDYCFFTKLEQDDDYEIETSISRYQISFSKTVVEDSNRIPWCPTFFNAGSVTYTSKISAYYCNNSKSLTVEKVDIRDYS